MRREPLEALAFLYIYAPTWCRLSHEACFRANARGIGHAGTYGGACTHRSTIQKQPVQFHLPQFLWHGRWAVWLAVFAALTTLACGMLTLQS